jgi:hypothetical protein
MKKIYILLFTLSFLSVKAQISEDQPIITRSNPSIANLMSFAEVPVNTNTGTPNISIPLASLPTRSKDVNVNVELSYHPSGISFNNKASDVGLGWNLIGDGVISRTMNNMPDEYSIPYWQSRLSSLENVRFDDVYSYNFMGYSGSFMIYFDASNNSFSIQKEDYNNLKIEFEMINGTQSVNSFVIYDDKGYKYVFDIKDRDTRVAHDMIKPSMLNPNGGPREILSQEYLMSPYPYINAHHLSKIYDNNGKELVSYFYNTTTKYYQGNPNISYDIKINKLSEIVSEGIGKVIFSYNNDTNLETSKSDTFELQNVTVKNIFNQTIKKFSFDYFFSELELNNYDIASRRMLQKVQEFNNTETTSIDTHLYYDTAVYSLPSHPNSCHEGYYGIDYFGYLNSNVNPLSIFENFDGEINDIKQPSKNVLRYGILKRIVHPSGGRVDYDFESHTYAYPDFMNTTGFDEYYMFNPDNHVYTEVLNTSFNTNNQTLIPFTVTGTEAGKFYFKLSANPYYSELNDPVDQPIYASLRVFVNGDYRTITNTSTSCLGEYIEMPPGNYTLQVMHVGNESATGSIVVTKRSRTTEPVKEWFYGGGLRIKKISHYTSSDSNATPAREINYNYQMFNNNNKTSGEIYDGGNRNFLTGSSVKTQICYKNVTIYDTENNGFTRHTYYSYFDTPYFHENYNDNFPYYQYYFSYKNGLLNKIEHFNSSGNLLKSTQNNYLFEEYNQIIYGYAIINLVFNNFSTKPSWAKLSSSVTSEFLNGSSNTPLTNTESFTYNSSNLKIDTQTKINSLGESLITKFFYHNGNSTLSQNRIAEIERIETFKGTELLNASKINYVNTFAGNVSYLPETIQTSKGNNAFENRLRYVLYDEFSNPLQVQKENGLQVCYIWGYNKTQPVAKLENIAYANIPSTLITNIQTLTSSPTATEAQIIAALNALRTSTDVNMQKAMITTFTYKPLVGITTITDSKGDIITYIYDSFNRLKEVRDKNNNLLSENEYHYKTQN